MSAVAYLRVSTHRQNLGIEAQRIAIEMWAVREGVSVVAWHIDAGVSGGSDVGDRPGLVAALGTIRVARAGILVVARRDRLARDVAIAETIEKATADAGSRVVSADGVGDEGTPGASFDRAVAYHLASHSAESVRLATKAALAAKRARGERAGAVPYGFTADDAGRLSPCPAEQDVIAAVRELRAAGLPLRAVVAELNRRGLVSRSGRPLALTQVARVARKGPDA